MRLEISQKLEISDIIENVEFIIKGIAVNMQNSTRIKVDPKEKKVF